MSTTPNAQTPGPLYVGTGHAIQTGDPASLSRGRILADLTHSDQRDLGAEARLFAASYTLLDRAGRNLGVDAATLAERLDLAALIRAAREANATLATFAANGGRLSIDEWSRTQQRLAEALHGLPA